jgi:ABC-type cobalt transport system substrate-binding protein
MAVVAPTSPARLYRAAGLGGVIAVAAWIAQPIVVGILAATETGYPSIETLQSRPYSGAIEAVIFSTIAIGFLVLVTALGRLATAAGATGLMPRVGTILGTVAGLSFLVAAGLSLGQYTSVGAGLAEVAPDTELQIALLDTIAVVMTGFVSVFALAGAAWLVVVATSFRAAGVVGWPLAIVAFVAAALVVGSLALPFAPPWGSLGPLLFALVGGIGLLIRSARAEKSAA